MKPFKERIVTKEITGKLAVHKHGTGGHEVQYIDTGFWVIQTRQVWAKKDKVGQRLLAQAKWTVEKKPLTM